MTTTEATKTICPLCQGTKARVIRRGVREHPDWPVYECTSCSLQYIVHSKDLNEYYRNEYRQVHSPITDKPASARQRFEMMRPLVNCMTEQFAQHVPMGRSVLDVGCSTGFFIDSIATLGYRVHGCDINPEDVPFVRDELGYPCEEGTVETAFAGRTFDCICSFNVIEHVADPVAWIQAARSRLNPGGILYTQTPNLDDALVAVYDISGFRDRWYREPHITYFSRRTLEMLMEKGGFASAETRIAYNEFYTLANHMNWLLYNKPMPTATIAQTPLIPEMTVHPRSSIMRRWFEQKNREYVDMLKRLEISSQLVAVCRKE